MNDISFPELQSLRIEMSGEVRDAQFESIVTALHQAPLAPLPLISRVRASWRKWTVAFAAIGTALVPVAAVASDSSLPGDFLYPVKLTVERIQVLFDDDLDAEHRVTELEELIERDFPQPLVDRHIVDTANVLNETTDRIDLVERYDDAVSDYVERQTHRRDRDRDASVDRRSPDRPTDDKPDDTAVITDTTAPVATTRPHRDNGDHESTTTTTHAESSTTTSASGGDAVDDDGNRDDAP